MKNEPCRGLAEHNDTYGISLSDVRLVGTRSHFNCSLRCELEYTPYRREEEVMDNFTYLSLYLTPTDNARNCKKKKGFPLPNVT